MVPRFGRTGGGTVVGRAMWGWVDMARGARYIGRRRGVSPLLVVVKTALPPGNKDSRLAGRERPSA